MRTRAKANSTHEMEVYIPKQEKRAPENEDNPDRKNKVKSQSHEPTFAIEAPPQKPKTKNTEKDHEPKEPRGRPSNIQAITIPSEPEKKQETPLKEKEKEKPKEQPKENLKQNRKQKQAPLKNEVNQKNQRKNQRKNQGKTKGETKGNPE